MSTEILSPLPRPGILDIAAYVPGKEHAPGVAKVYKLSSNETPLGPSPKAIEAFQKAAEKLEIYPDGLAMQLREAIGSVYGLNTANMMCGNGSDELLGLLCHVYLGAGDEGIITEHGFLVYKIQIMAAGATPVTVKEKRLPRRRRRDPCSRHPDAQKSCFSPIRAIRPAPMCR